MAKDEVKNAFQTNFDGIKNLPIMMNELAQVNFEKKDYEKALKCYEESLKYLNAVYVSIDKTAEGNQHFIEILHKQFDSVRENITVISRKIGDMKFKEKNFEEALNYYRDVLCSVSDERLLYKVSICLQHLGAFSSSILFLKSVLEINPTDFLLCKLIGDIYNENLKNYEKAIEYYLNYIENEQKDKKTKAIVCNIIGHLYENLGVYQNVDKEIEYFEKAIELNPDLVEAYRNLTVVYPRRRREQDALKCFKKMFELGAKMDDFFDYACMNIKLKDFAEGWEYYEYRFSKENGASVYPSISKPKWKGQKILDKTLLVQCEQGFGDSIQFLRYMPRLNNLAKKVIFRVQSPLFDLFKINENDFEIVSNKTPLEKIKFDYHVPLMSLMHILKVQYGDFPFPEGYIKASETKIKKYKKEIFNNDCFKIGITWHGSANGNERRNIPLEVFYPLTKLKNVKVYSFQKDSKEISNLPPEVEIVDLGKDFKDFSDTAAALANIDLYITSDNGVFNLAGAMGVKTYLLLNFDAEWRWFKDMDTNPWYDSVKVLRKKDELDSWDVLIQDVIKLIPKGK
jgi:tetratricopeptide (TPR) repeat protein